MLLILLLLLISPLPPGLNKRIGKGSRQSKSKSKIKRSNRGTGSWKRLLHPFFGSLLADSAFYGFLFLLQTRENPG